MIVNGLNKFKFYCNKVLPLVYDDSLSYYEVLSKCINAINDLIDNGKILAEDIEELESDVAEIKKWIEDFDIEGVYELIEGILSTMIFVQLDNSGHIVYYFPTKWKDLEFNTSGKDIDISGIEYGRLVLSY